MALSDHNVKDKPSRLCRFSIVYELLTEEDKKTLGEWIVDRVPQRVIVSALKAEYPDTGSMSDGTLSNHCHGRCSCPQDSPHRKVWAS